MNNTKSPTTIFLLVFATLITTVAQARADERPNIVVIVADDLGFGDLGVTGNRKIKTPHLDELARNGAVFNHFYSPAQVCSASRASMITGRMPHRTGIYSFIGGSSGDLVHLPKTETTLAQILRKAGYQTALIGKWHNSLNLVQAKNDLIPSMNHYGLDYWFSSDDNAINLNKPNWLRNGRNEGARKGYTANTVGKEAVHWLTEVRDSAKPFIQFIHFYEPHWTVEAPESLVADYLTSTTKNVDEANYYGAVSNVDHEVGNIMNALGELGIAEDTAVFFSSDHGPAELGSSRFKRNYGSAEPYRGNKYGLWEGSIHVPGIVHWPSKVKPGLIIDEPAGSIDWLPTICDITDTSVPDDLILDGQSHLPLLLGKSITRRKPLQWHHYNTTAKNSPNPNAVMRRDNYVICGFYEQTPETRLKRASWNPSHLKRIKNGSLVRFALFDVLKDPKQQQDLAQQESKRFEEMRVQLIAAHAEMQEQAIGWNGAAPIRFEKPAKAHGKAGAPEIAKVMDLESLKVANRPDIEKTYKYLREPNAVVTKDGTLVVVAGPHHLRGKNDRAHQDLLCRTSRDAGRTWSDITLIADAGMDSIVPSALVYDEQKDRVLCVYNVFFNDPDRDKAQIKTSEQFVIQSDDAGTSWSPPREILKDLSGLCVFGGSSGFQLSRGKHKGRLMVPGGHRDGGFLHGYFYSDDHGKSWAFQQIRLNGRQEATGCELADGTIMLSHRQSGYGMAAMFSHGDSGTWSNQQVILPDAWSSCNNSALSILDCRGKQHVLIAAPLGPKNADRYVAEQDAAKLKRGAEDSKQVGRSNGGVFFSSDGGKSWPIGVCVAPGWTFGYNALVALPNGEIGLVFEGSPSGVDWTTAKRDHNTGARLGIYLVRFRLDWLLSQNKQK